MEFSGGGLQDVPYPRRLLSGQAGYKTGRYLHAASETGTGDSAPAASSIPVPVPASTTPCPVSPRNVSGTLFYCVPTRAALKHFRPGLLMYVPALGAVIGYFFERSISGNILFDHGNSPLPLVGTKAVPEVNNPDMSG